MDATIKRRKTLQVAVGHVMVGSEHPVMVQSMTNTDTADAVATAQQVFELAQAGSEVVRITVNSPAAAGRHGLQRAAGGRFPLQRRAFAEGLSGLRTRAGQVPYQPR